jgi:hypothetical protein
MAVKQALRLSLLLLLVGLLFLPCAGYANDLAVDGTSEEVEASLKTCPVHQEALQKALVDINYGLPYYEPGFLDAQSALFPNAFRYVEGGCVIFEGQEKEANVHYCSSCRNAEKEWFVHRGELR